MAGVRLQGIRKIYDDATPHVAVHDVDLEIADGELVVLVGPSGSGKSTVLRMIAGLESITGGELRIGGRLVNDMAPKDRDVAMVFQSYALYPHMTVFRNMAFSLELRRTPKADIDRRVRAAATMFGLDTLLDRYPRQLSGGQRQRVAVGRAIVRQPQVFLFDEPLSNLDAALRVQLRREIAALHRRLGATMIYVTHDQVEAMTLGERIVVLADGRVQQVDPPIRLYDEPRNRFVAQFIGSPAMNILQGAIARDDGLRFRSASGRVVLDVPEPWSSMLDARPQTDTLLGVRPEDVRLAADGEQAHAKFRIDAVEPMGNETLVHAAAADGGFAAERLTARVGARELPEIGTERGFVLDRARVHFFDSQSGERIR
jgi:multiple sugar transport system ATP-binding protein